MNENPINEIPKPCLECGEPLGAGREDRKFCNDICRTAFNNRRRKENMLNEPAAPYQENRDFQKVFGVLLKNREILHMHYLYSGDTAELRDLLGKGFNLKYFTSEYQDKDFRLFKFCFDFGYHIPAKDLVYITERHDEIFLPHH